MKKWPLGLRAASGCWSLAWATLLLLPVLAGCDSQPTASSSTGPAVPAVPPPPPASSVPPPPPVENLPATGPAYETPPGYQLFGDLNVKLRCPEGFQPSTKVVGFERQSPPAMIHIGEIPNPSDVMLQRFQQDGFGAAGFKALSKEEFAIGPHQALLVNYEQPDENGVNWQKWGLLFGNEEKTTMIVAAYPPDAAAELSGPIKETLLGVKLDPKYNQYVTRNTVGPATGKMKRARSLRDEEVYFETDESTPRTGVSPFLMVSKLNPRDEAHDKREFATVVAETANGSTGTRVKSIEPITLDGVEGFEIYADTEDQATGAPVSMYVVVLLPPGGYYRIRGSVGADRSAEFLPEFRAMVHGWKRS